MKKLIRSKNDRKILGVCGGIAEYLETDPTIIRLLWVISTVVFGAGFWMYFIFALVMPEENVGVNRKEETVERKTEEETINLDK